MSDIFLLGGTSGLIQPDALDDFTAAASIESGVLFELQGRMIGDGSPVGERVFRRVCIVVMHDRGCAFYATPAIDGTRLSSLRTYFSRPAPASMERHVFVLPLGIVHSDFPNIMLAPCGTVGEVYIDFTDPKARFHVQDAYFAMEPLNPMRARAAGE